MADEPVDEESAQDGGEEDTDAPKKTFGILAARFLQKGRSSPGSITGEFEALSPPTSKSSPDSQVRNLHPIDDEDEEIREGSVHGMEVPLSESLYADIGLDDMSSYDDAGSESSLEASVPTFEESVDTTPDVVYDIDAAEQPVISYGSGVDAEHAQDVELTAAENEEVTQYASQESQYEQAAEAEPEQQYLAEDVSETGSESYQYESEEVAATGSESSHQYESEEVAATGGPEPSYRYKSEEAAETGSASSYQYDAEEVAQSPEHEYASESAGDEVAQPEYSETAEEQTEVINASELDAIGTASASEATVFDKKALDQIGTDNAVNNKIFVTNEPPAPPEKKGLLGKFASKKESAVRPLIGGSKKETVPEPTGGRPFDAAALDSIGTSGYDASALNSIGTSGYDSGALDSIGTTGYDASSLDSIGTTGYDASALDSIGSKGTGAGALDSTAPNSFDASTLDSIGTKGFDKGALDAIGEPSSPGAETKEKPAKSGGLLGGKFGQKAKVLGSEKSKLGGIVPPSTDPTFDQKETGRFMVNAPEGSDSVGTVGTGDSLTSAPFEAFSAQPADFSAEPTQFADDAASSEEGAAPAKEALSASFFDDAKETYVEEENIPVIGSDEIGRLITDADAAYRLKQYKAAEPIFATVLEKLDKIGDDTDPLLPYCLDKMADNLFQMKKYKESLQFFRRLLVLHTKISSADRDMISTLYKIAQTSEALNLTSEADSMYKRAFRLGQQSLVPGDPLLAKVLEGYGTMLMRSEGAEPPAAAGAEKTSEEATAEKASTLSAEEIAMLNSLGASADRAASEASPIILSGGLNEQSSSKARSPLKETDERADKARAESAGPRVSGAGNVWIRLGVFIAIIAGFVIVTLNMNTDYTTHHVAHSKDFVKRVYKSLDGLSTFTIVSEDQAAKDNFGKHFVYEYRDWAGTPSDDMEVISGQVGGDNFIYEVPQGIKDGSGFIYYDPHAPELSVTAKMHELGNKAQAFYKANGKYPEGKDLDKLVKSLTYKNPFGDGADSVTANSIAWPPTIDASQIFIKSKFDTNLEDGNPWEGEPPGKPGQISAAASSTKQPDATVFCVHGRDRTGGLITRADGKVLVLIFKNGIEVTPGAADLKNEKPSPAPVQMRLSKTNSTINILTIMLSYIPIILFAILSVVFLSLVNKGPDRSKGFSVPTFGIIWSPIMVLLSGLAKFLPSPFSTVCLVLAVVAFIGGLGWIGYKIAKTSPKKSKKPPPEASTM